MLTVRQKIKSVNVVNQRFPDYSLKYFNDVGCQGYRAVVLWYGVASSLMYWADEDK